MLADSQVAVFWVAASGLEMARRDSILKSHLALNGVAWQRHLARWTTLARIVELFLAMGAKIVSSTGLVGSSI